MRLPSSTEIDQAAQALLAEKPFTDDPVLRQRLDSSKVVLQLAQHSIGLSDIEDLPPKKAVLAILEAAITTFFRLGVLAGAAMPKEAQE